MSIEFPERLNPVSNSGVPDVMSDYVIDGYVANYTPAQIRDWKTGLAPRDAQAFARRYNELAGHPENVGTAAGLLGGFVLAEVWLDRYLPNMAMFPTSIKQGTVYATTAAGVLGHWAGNKFKGSLARRHAQRERSR